MTSTLNNLRKSLKADFKKLYTPQFTTTWEAERLIRETEIDIMSLQAIEAYIAEQNAEAFIKWGWGERCESTDKEDFPDTDYEDPNNARCANCEMWEHYDEWLDHLSKNGEKESDIEHQPVDIETKIKALKRPDAPKAVYMIEAELTDLVELIDTENTNSRLVELDLLEQALNDGRDMHQYKMMRLKELTNDI